ncbi:hypothetical protein [Burkholderia vietnamiensis]|uniref:hypothetical protein n=1 Tax=Burkholderia vietnamiensis TaxID=60552 RepID=UPI0018DD8012|nr:hypothetical protein [Burkholderia vietnamiensis]MBH9645092.1 hypothetical protein [Burkholderia vietnamiensis]
MIDQDKMRALAEKLREDYRNSIKVLPWPYRSAISSTPMEAADAIDLLLAEVEGLRAARIAYASEFAPDAEGLPDTGNIHANIRRLKADLEAAAADKRDGHRYRELLGLLLAGDIPMPESSVSLNVCGVPPNQDEFDEAVDFLLAQRQGEGS